MKVKSTWWHSECYEFKDQSDPRVKTLREDKAWKRVYNSARRNLNENGFVQILENFWDILRAMTGVESVYDAVQNYRLGLESEALLLPISGETWWSEVYFIADLICRDKIMRMLTDPDQMCRVFYKHKQK